MFIFMKRVRLNQLNVGDVIHYESRFWLVESVTTYCTYSGGPRHVGCLVKIYDCDDIFHTKLLKNNSRFYTVLSD